MADDPPLPGMRSLLLAPMVARSIAEGLLVVGSRQAGAYSAGRCVPAVRRRQPGGGRSGKRLAV